MRSATPAPLTDHTPPPHHPAGGRRARLVRAAWPVPLLALAFLVYWPVLTDPFALDDYIWLHAVRAAPVEVVRQAFTFPRPADFAVPTPFWRPLIDLYFLGAERLFGLHALPYHIINVVLHGLNGVLLALLVRRLTRSRGTALLAAALFLIWPSYDYAVAWISSVTELLGAALSLATLVLYAAWLHAERRSRLLYAGALTALALALLAKQSAATLPAVLLLLHWLLAPSGNWREMRRAALALTPFAALTLVYAAFLYGREYETAASFEVYRIGPHGAAHIWQYLERLTLPVDAEAGSLAVPVRMATAGAVLLAGAVAALRRWWTGLVAVLWMLIALLPFSFFPAGVESRYTYLAAAPLALLLAGAVMDLGRVLVRRTGLRVTVLTGLAVTVPLGVLLVRETRHRQAWLSGQAAAYQQLYEGVPAACGPLPPASAIVLIDAPVVDLYGDSTRMALNLRYDRVYVVRPADLYPPPGLAAAPEVCRVRYADGRYQREAEAAGRTP